MSDQNVLRAVDDESRKLAKTLIRTARHGALACLEPDTMNPLVSQVNVATDIDGQPCFLISRLSAHFAALESDPRCSLLLGSPGKGDPAAHARTTIIGSARMLTGTNEDVHELQSVRRRFLAKHPKSALYVDFGDFAFWQVVVSRAALNGGFGKAYALDRSDVTSRSSDCAGLDDLEAAAVSHMNEEHAGALKLYARNLAGDVDGDWKIAGIDAEGLDLILSDRLVRVWFDAPLVRADDLRPVLMAMAQEARQL
ncbi:MAG: HugZ family protein [Hyphomicrobiaceae bacterium]